jgi:hypothetical protein
VDDVPGSYLCGQVGLFYASSPVLEEVTAADCSRVEVWLPPSVRDGERPGWACPMTAVEEGIHFEMEIWVLVVELVHCFLERRCSLAEAEVVRQQLGHCILLLQ